MREFREYDRYEREETEEERQANLDEINEILAWQKAESKRIDDLNVERQRREDQEMRMTLGTRADVPLEVEKVTWVYK